MVIDHWSPVSWHWHVTVTAAAHALMCHLLLPQADKTRMLEMFSQQNEKVEFEKPVDAKGNIEVWLQRLVDGMQDTVKAIIKRAVRNVQVGAGRLHVAINCMCGRPDVPLHVCAGLYTAVNIVLLAVLGSFTCASFMLTPCCSLGAPAGDGPGGLHLQPPCTDRAAGHPVPVDGRHAGGAHERSHRQEYHEQEHEEDRQHPAGHGELQLLPPSKLPSLLVCWQSVWSTEISITRSPRLP